MKWALKLLIVAIAAFIVVLVVGFFVIITLTHNGKTDALSLKQLQSDAALSAISSQQPIAHRSDNNGYCESGVVAQPFISMSFSSTDENGIKNSVSTTLQNQGWTEQPRDEAASTKLAFTRLNSGYTETAAVQEYSPGQLTLELSSDAKHFSSC